MRISLAKELRVITEAAEAKYKKIIEERIAIVEAQNYEDNEENEETIDKKDLADLRKAIIAACKEAAGFRKHKLIITCEGSDSFNVKRYLKDPEKFDSMFESDSSGSDNYEWLSPLGKEVLKRLRLKHSVSDSIHFCRIIIRW